MISDFPPEENKYESLNWLSDSDANFVEIPNASTSNSRPHTKSGRLYIAIIIHVLDRGGAESAILTLIEGLLSRGHHVDLLLNEFHGSRLSQIPKGVNLFVLDRKYHQKVESAQCSIPIESIKWLKPPTGFKAKVNAFLKYINSLNLGNSVRLAPRRRHFYGATALSSYLKSKKPDLIYAILPRSCYVSIIARRWSLAKLPIVWSIHSDSIDKFSNRDRNYFDRLIRYADEIHACSSGVAESLVKYIDTRNLLSSPFPRVTAIHNAFNTERLLSLSAIPITHDWFATSTNEEKDDSSKIILATGRLGRVKNFALLLNAFALVLKRIDAKLVILGEGGERANLEGQVHKLRIAHAVSMPGWVDNPYPYMAQADVFVLSSDYEGMPMVLGEALICGCAVVSTDCPSGPKEYLKQGQLGWLVPVGDEEAMADAIYATLRKPPNREEIVKRGLEFDVDCLIPRYEAMFHRVVEEYRNRS